MDTKRAIEILQGRDKFVSDVNIDAKIAYRMAIEALEKQIPIKPVYDGNILVCPICESLVIANEDIYCWRCGHMLEQKQEIFW